LWFGRNFVLHRIVAKLHSQAKEEFFGFCLTIKALVAGRQMRNGFFFVLIPVFLFSFQSSTVGQVPQNRLQLYNLNGELHRSTETLESLNTNQKIVYSFWSFTCLPCMSEFPQLLRLQKENDTVKFYYVNVLDDKDKILGYVEKNGLDKSAILLDERLAAAKSFSVLNARNQPVLPQLFVMRKNGKISLRISGYTESSMKQLSTALGEK
jgi:thiol-disulfide isomerase/thioredoxin